MIIHPIEPVFDEHAKILILGTFPSVKSRESEFYYGHPQNRFWRLISNIYDVPLPCSIDDKKYLLLSHNIALWDVIHSCDIIGSSDATIRNVTPNDLSVITDVAQIHMIITNGSTAHKYYNKYILQDIGVADLCLPSTSPANARWSLDMLREKWNIIKTEA